MAQSRLLIVPFIHRFMYCRFLTEEAIPTTTHGAKQRAKDGYYACYKLTSERKQDDEFQATINSEIIELEPDINTALGVNDNPNNDLDNAEA